MEDRPWRGISRRDGKPKSQCGTHSAGKTMLTSHVSGGSPDKSGPNPDPFAATRRRRGPRRDTDARDEAADLQLSTIVHRGATVYVSVQGLEHHALRGRMSEDRVGGVGSGGGDRGDGDSGGMTNSRGVGDRRPPPPRGPGRRLGRRQRQWRLPPPLPATWSCCTTAASPRSAAGMSDVARLPCRTTRLASPPEHVGPLPPPVPLMAGVAGAGAASGSTTGAPAPSPPPSLVRSHRGSAAAAADAAGGALPTPPFPLARPQRPRSRGRFWWCSPRGRPRRPPSGVAPAAAAKRPPPPAPR